MFIREIAPAVAEIEDAIASNLWQKNLVDGVIHSGAKVAALGVVIANAADAPALLQAASGLAPVGVAAWQAHRSWQEQREATERNQMFFYYQADKELTRLT